MSAVAQFDVVLQAAGISCWTDGQFWGCVIQPLVNQIGEPLFGLLLGGTLIVAFYFASGSIAAPAVLLMVLSGLMLQALPGGFRGVAWSLMFLGLVAAFISVAEKYVMNPGVQ